MDLMKDDFLTRYETPQRALLRPSHYLVLTTSTKSSLLTKLITRPTMYNSAYGRLLRSFIATVDSSSPVTTRTTSFQRSILAVQSSISQSKAKQKPVSQPNSLSVSGLYLRERGSRMIQQSWQRLFRSTSLTSGESSMNSSDTQRRDPSTLAFWRR